MKKKNKKNLIGLTIIIGLAILIYLSKGIFFWSSTEASKTITEDITEPIVIEQNLESYNDKANLKFDIKLSSGDLKVETYDNNDNIIWQDNIDGETSYQKNVKIRDFGDKVKVKITPEKASADVNVAFNSR